MTALTHAVLGGNGITGTETIRALLRRGEAVTSVGRRPCTIDGTHSETADLRSPADASRVLAGKDVAYFTVGLPYSARVWAAEWPVILSNVIDAAVQHGTHLVYLDNVYAYGEVDAPMTEQTPLRPTSKKGQIRADAIRALETARTKRGLHVTVGRSADFYGPGATTSMINDFVIDRAAADKRCTWLFDAGLAHSLTYTPDIGEALAILGTDPVALNRTWHLPTAPALTGQEYVEMAAGSDARAKVMSLGTVRFGALFNSSARETLELVYQFAKPYVFDSSLFESTFSLAPTSAADGFAETLAAARNRNLTRS
ncbi:NAD-dependent epimerase/dehydratase family protein [Tessaracoccus caeni]|uniref:NAD-dependent epimerase/dehydratase family protein n=1 Tax=Tessaracoccus caeni TaxID=3031239 RepID=UPI0023D97C63|nr:NAD-dependent epimerase/dehydratase family protein [Tessaracoccus caeni]MDF1489683.1 NAD-dependent epimerase/dehydratase family protein [Tessaracoccus caeni]